jgi:hypothetical protein
MRLYCDKRELNYVFFQDKIIADKKQEYIQKRVATTTGEVAESFYIHQLLEGRIEKINNRSDIILHRNCVAKLAKNAVTTKTLID